MDQENFKINFVMQNTIKLSRNNGKHCQLKGSSSELTIIIPCTRSHRDHSGNLLTLRPSAAGLPGSPRTRCSCPRPARRTKI